MLAESQGKQREIDWGVDGFLVYDSGLVAPALALWQQVLFCCAILVIMTLPALPRSTQSDVSTLQLRDGHARGSSQFASRGCHPWWPAAQHHCWDSLCALLVTGLSVLLLMA